MNEAGAISPFLHEHWDRLADAAKRGPILDLACGRGRHALACARAGWSAVGLDRNPAHLRELAGSAAARTDVPAALSPVCADVETEHGLPIAAGTCGAILVFRFLFRPLAPSIERALVPGGLLIYETFTTGQRALGFGPRSDSFLLEPDELPTLFPNLEVLTHNEGMTDEPRPSMTARLVAQRPI